MLAASGFDRNLNSSLYTCGPSERRWGELWDIFATHTTSYLPPMAIRVDVRDLDWGSGVRVATTFCAYVHNFWRKVLFPGCWAKSPHLDGLSRPQNAPACPPANLGIAGRPPLDRYLRL